MLYSLAMVIAVLVFNYLLLSLVVAYAGRRRAFGFWGYFFFSLLVTPVVGLLAILGGAPHAKN